MSHLPVDQALQIAARHHQNGQFPQAEKIYRQILALQPNHPDALHLLGVLAGQAGQPGPGIDLIQRAIAGAPGEAVFYNNLGNLLKQNGQLPKALAAYHQALQLKPDYPNAYNNLGNALKQNGQLDEAVAAYQKALQLKPDYADAYNNLGNALNDKGQHAEALAALRRALALNPNLAEAHNNLGSALKGLRQLDQSIASFRRAIALKPDMPEMHNNLGIVLHANKQSDEAIGSLRQALQLRPDYVDAHNNLGLVLHARGELDEAIAHFRHAIRLDPNCMEGHNNLGSVLNAKGQLDDAIAADRRALALKPDYAKAHNNLGVSLMAQGRLDEALASFQSALQSQPHFAEAHNNLGIALDALGQIDEAMAAFREALRLQPGFADALSNLGNAFKDIGQLPEAVMSYRKALWTRPDCASAYHNLLHTLHFHPESEASSLRQEHLIWAREHAEPLRRFIQPHTNDRDPERRLRIGYVSPDFRDHVIGRNMLPLLRRHDRTQVEVFCYANVLRADAMTGQFRQCADTWHNILGVADAQVAELIRHDRIDILIDLALHLDHNRLLVFAYKPAPLQLTFAGYPGSTGLETIDYRLTDPYLDPASGDDSVYSEKSLRLPDTFWCYDPLGTDVPVNPLPAPSTGTITFGCLNNFCKVNDQVLRLWAQVLKAVAGSRLMMLSPPGSHRQRTLDFLAQQGIDPVRITFISPAPRARYLEQYHQIDIGLDTFPYNGHTTSLDSYWMGVPVVTLVGRTVVGRAGLSQLTNLGLPELIARSPEEFVQIAANLAADLPRLASLRSALRQKMECSPLMDAPRFAQAVEAAYRQVWRQWCAAPVHPARSETSDPV